MRLNQFIIQNSLSWLYSVCKWLSSIFSSLLRMVRSSLNNFAIVSRMNDLNIGDLIKHSSFQGWIEISHSSLLKNSNHISDHKYPTRPPITLVLMSNVSLENSLKQSHPGSSSGTSSLCAIIFCMKFWQIEQLISRTASSSCDFPQSWTRCPRQLLPCDTVVSILPEFQSAFLLQSHRL